MNVCEESSCESLTTYMKAFTSTRNASESDVESAPGWVKPPDEDIKARALELDYSQHPTFQGGAMPMIRRIPKRGFNNKWALKVGEVNISDIEANFEAGDEVTPEYASR